MTISESTLHFKNLLIGKLHSSPTTFAECHNLIKKYHRTAQKEQLILMHSYLALLYLEAGAITILKEQVLTLKKLKSELLEEVEINSTLLSCIDELIRNFSEEVSQNNERSIFSSQELQFIELLQNRGPLDKFEIISALFGNEIDFFKAENRMKNLVFRIRKKCPDKILLTRGKYSLINK